MSKKQNNKFLTYLTKLEPVEVYGLARIMKVPILKDKELKKGEELLFDLVEAFPKLKGKPRKQIIQILEEVKNDGFGAKNKEEE